VSGSRRRLGAIAFGTVTAVVLLAAPCGADPSPSARDVARGAAQVHDRAAEIGRLDAALAQAGGRLNDLNNDAELAIERYNGARVRLDQAEKDYQAALQRSGTAHGRLDQARHQLAVFAANAYRSDNTFPSAMAVLGGRGGPSGFLERATFMQVLANRQHAVMQQEKAADTVAGMFQHQAQQALKNQRDATRGAASARQAAVAAVARQKTGVRQIAQQKAGISAALVRAKANYSGLQRRRAAALAHPPAAVRAVPRAPVPRAPAPREISRNLARGSGLGVSVAQAALRWLGTPYSWGGGNASGPSLGIEQGAHTVGFDCSGLVTYAWARAGIRLVHYATTQYNSGPHPARNQLRPGDLVFFAHDPSNPATIHHVGIYVGHDQMVEAPFTGARVRLSYAFRPDYAGATRPAG
jgi:cell wall-associated NlpC family hydrolase